MVYVARAGWTTDPKPERKLTALVSSQVKGIAVHYTGSKGSLGENPSIELSKRRLLDELEFHTKGRGWTDIAYNYAIDQNGRVFELRGLAYRSAANGDQKTNSAYLAVTFLIGTADKPSQAAVQAFLELRRNTILSRYPAATRIVGHRDLYQTECPGGPLYALVRSGALSVNPKVPQEDDMPSSAEVADEVWNRFTISTPEGKEIRLQEALELILKKLS